MTDTPQSVEDLQKVNEALEAALGVASQAGKTVQDILGVLAEQDKGTEAQAQLQAAFGEIALAHVQHQPASTLGGLIRSCIQENNQAIAQQETLSH